MEKIVARIDTRHLDQCVCGDYRQDHKDGSGRCKMPDDLTHGFETCHSFRLAKQYEPGAR